MHLDLFNDMAYYLFLVEQLQNVLSCPFNPIFGSFSHLENISWALLSALLWIFLACLLVD